MRQTLVKFLVFSCLAVLISSSAVFGDEDWPEGFPIPGEKVDQNGMPMESMVAGAFLNNDVKSINVDITLPENHKLLTEAKPFVRLFTKKGEVFKADITSPKQIISVNKYVDEEMLYAEVGLFYCRQGKQGICLIKKLLYLYGVRNQATLDQLQLRYTVREEY